MNCLTLVHPCLLLASCGGAQPKPEGRGCCIHHIHLLGCSAAVRSGRREVRANRGAQITDEQVYHIRVFALGFRGNSRRGKEMTFEDKRKC